MIKSKENILLENKFNLRITFMIISGFLGFLTLIGIFWGKEGYLYLGIGILIIIIGLMMASINSYGGWD